VATRAEPAPAPAGAGPPPLSVIFGAAAATPGTVGGRAVAVIDVLRASTTIAGALANGARAVVPFADAATAAERARDYARGEVVLAGERQMRRVPGFDCGNSPGEFTREAVAGRTVLLATTNGTPALAAAAAAGARHVISAAFVNLGAARAFLRAALRGGLGVTIVCAGQDRQFALEDAACAGRLARELVGRAGRAAPDDAARACALLDRRYRNRPDRLWADAAHARALAAAGYEADLAACAAVDVFPVVPTLVHGQLVAHAAAAPSGAAARAG
jgi:2-phosphosulfolactate phosphatase